MVSSSSKAYHILIPGPGSHLNHLKSFIVVVDVMRQELASLFDKQFMGGLPHSDAWS